MNLHLLLPHYERELAELHALATEFAAGHPQVGARMAASGELLHDPHVERLMQACAFLGARVRHRLNDDHAQFSQSYLGLLYPHYLRPLPACAIVCFVNKEAGRRPQAAILPRGYEVEALLEGSGTSSFRTTADLQVLPLRIAAVGFRPSAEAPDETLVPSRTTAILSLELELVAPQASWSDPGIDTIRVHVAGERVLVEVLREALASRVLATMVQSADRPGWVVDDLTVPRGAGFDDAEALVDFSTGGYPVYRLLTEYFAFPAKFDFIDIALPAAARSCTNPSMTLHFALGSLRAGADDMAVLQKTSTANLRLGCVPVINLFDRRTSPQSILPGVHSHPVVVKNAAGRASDIHAIRQVFRIRKESEGALDDITATIPPFLSLRHDRYADGAPTPHWIEHRAPDRQRVGGTEIGFVDLEMAPVDGGVDTFAADVLATDRGVSSRIRIGKPGGDFANADNSWESVSFLTQPTPSYSFETADGNIWRLISQLSINDLLFSGQGIDALKSILSLYDLPRSATNRKLRDGLVAISSRTVQGFIRLDGLSSLTRGTEVTLRVSDDALVGVDLHLFADLLGRFFALAVHTNSFTQLKLVSARTGKVVILGERRSGEIGLL